MRVGVLGINHKLAELELREILARTCQRRLAPNQSTHGSHFFVLLSTCNRTEIYFSSEDLTATHSYLLSILRHDVNEDFDQKLYSYFGQDCLLHLCRVAAGLDSAIIAETEIQGQVKNSYETAKEYLSLPYELHHLFQKSLGIAKKARVFLPVKPGLPDIEHAIFQTGQHFFQNSDSPNILFIGASSINEKVLSHLVAKNRYQITLTNRTASTGLQMAEKYGIKFLPWETIPDWHHHDLVVLGTKASDFILKSSSLPSVSSQKLIFDLSVPRNVDPELARHSMVTLLNIDQINRGLNIRQKKLERSLEQAESLINQSISHLMVQFHEKEKHRLRVCAVGA